MNPDPEGPDEVELVVAARAGDEQAFGRLVALHQGRLTAHCYRMLGSFHDAEDAVQDTLVKAWRGLPDFDGRSRVGSWLFRIATTTCLNALRGRSRRALPVDTGFRSTDPRDAAGPPLVESVWVEPLPDQSLGPEASYELRESVELALVAAWQHLPARQRAALLLTDVLGYPAREAADMLDTTTPALNSALQRARTLVAERVPAQSQQATLRELGDAATNTAVERFRLALEQADVGAVIGQLREDAVWSMPPQPAWFAGPDAIADFLSTNPFRWFRWRYLPTRANGQPALAAYSWDDAAGRYLPHSIDVLSFTGDRIAAVTSFLDVTRRGVTGPGFRSFAETRLFDRFRLPASLQT
ncbi:MAG: sigma-70 family RNA polymerase sigma factor [Mycobacteriales bacterium]